jgi:hypothetical protein
MFHLTRRKVSLNIDKIKTVYSKYTGAPASVGAGGSVGLFCSGHTAFKPVTATITIINTENLEIILECFYFLDLKYES